MLNSARIQVRIFPTQTRSQATRCAAVGMFPDTPMPGRAMVAGDCSLTSAARGGSFGTRIRGIFDKT